MADLVPHVRIVVVGDPGSGKTSLITAVVQESFSERVPPVLPHTRLPENLLPDRVPVTVVDTSSRKEDRPKVEQELKKADAIVLTYESHKLENVDRIGSYWLPEIRRLGIKSPVIVVGCKLDLRSDRQPSLEQVMQPKMNEFREIETSLECSAKKLVQVAEVFYYAQKSVCHPTPPLFDTQTQSLKPRCVHALKRIFKDCDHDRDGVLNDEELNQFQIKCFNAPLQAVELAGVKKVVQEKMPSGVTEAGLTLTGFLFLHALFIERGRLETTWTVLRKFGYNNELELREDQLPLGVLKRAPDQGVELTEKGIDFLRGLFSQFDLDSDGALRLQDIEELFSTAPSNPWEADEYRGAVEASSNGGLTLNGFLSSWSLMVALNPPSAMAHLVYVGFPQANVDAAFRVQKRRRAERKNKTSTREVVQCFVFGASEEGRAALMDKLINSSQSRKSISGTRYAASIVDFADADKTLILRDFDDSAAAKLLATSDGLAPCDVAAFVYDSSSPENLASTVELLSKVADTGEGAGYEVPCALLAAQTGSRTDDPTLSDAIGTAEALGLEAPMVLNLGDDDLSGVYKKLVERAMKPHLCIPETDSSRAAKQRKWALQKNIMLTTGVATVLVGGIIAYRIYASRKQTS